MYCQFKTDVSFGFEADNIVPSGLKEEINFLATKFPPRCPPCCFLRFSREHNARVHLTFPLTEMYGYSRLCDRLRSPGARMTAQMCSKQSMRTHFAAVSIACDYIETALFAIVCDLRLACIASVSSGRGVKSFFGRAPHFSRGQTIKNLPRKRCCAG